MNTNESKKNLTELLKLNNNEIICIVYFLIYSRINSKLSFLKNEISKELFTNTSEVIIRVINTEEVSEKKLVDFLVLILDIQDIYFKELEKKKLVNPSYTKVANDIYTRHADRKNSNNLLRTIIAYQGLLAKCDKCSNISFNLLKNYDSITIDTNSYKSYIEQINTYYDEYLSLFENDQRERVIAANAFFVEFQNFFTHFSFVVSNELNSEESNSDINKKNEERALVHLKRSYLDLLKILLASYIKSDVVISENNRFSCNHYISLLKIRDDEIISIGDSDEEIAERYIQLIKSLK